MSEDKIPLLDAYLYLGWTARIMAECLGNTTMSTKMKASVLHRTLVDVFKQGQASAGRGEGSP